MTTSEIKVAARRGGAPEAHGRAPMALVIGSALTFGLVATRATAQTCVPAPSGMVSWYRMEGSASDQLGANNPSATSAISFVAGEVGQGVTFGSGGFIDIPDSPSLRLQQITLDAWVRPDGPGPNNDAAGSIIVGKNINSNDVSVQLAWFDQSGGRFRLNFFGAAIVSANAFPAGAFYHVAGTYDGSTYRLYVNGMLEGSFALVQTITYSSLPWDIGANNPSARSIGFPRTWNGVIDEVEIINRALSASEVAALYAAGSVGKCYCGNGIVEPGEQCDDGNTVNGDGCDNNCTFTACGNGIVTAGEQCDDGNTSNGDCCSATCQFETGACPDDGNPCTNDQCNAGSCTHPTNTASCDDGIFCNGADTCSGGACTTHAGNPCTGGPECAHTCNEAADNCFDPVTTACTSDGNVCTNDHCSGSGACVHPNNTAPCNDGLFCNGADTCSGGACTVHAGNPCAGGPVCAHTCNEAADNCFDLAGTVCRPAAGDCDVAETCTGAGPTCPADAHQPDGTSCDDGNACTMGDACSGGTCVGPSATVCDPCETCTPAGGCVLPTAPGCQAAAGGGASILLHDGGALPDLDSLKWKWKSSGTVGLADFGDPTTTTDLTVCVIDQGGLKLSATAPAGGTCRTRPCWSVIPGRKLRYSDNDLTPDGVQKMQAQPGGPDRGKIQVKGKGANLAVPALGLATPVTVRLVRSGGPACWESTYETNVITNTPDTFKAKSD